SSAILSLHLCSFFSSDAQPSRIYTLSLHDALPISHHERQKQPYGRQHTYHHYRTQRPAYEKTESLRMQGVEFDNGDMYVDGHKADRKSGSAGMPRPISYAVFCLKKKKTHKPERLCD